MLFGNIVYGRRKITSVPSKAQLSLKKESHSKYYGLRTNVEV